MHIFEAPCKHKSAFVTRCKNKNTGNYYDEVDNYSELSLAVNNLVVGVRDVILISCVLATNKTME